MVVDELVDDQPDGGAAETAHVHERVAAMQRVQRRGELFVECRQFLFSKLCDTFLTRLALLMLVRVESLSREPTIARSIGGSDWPLR